MISTAIGQERLSRVSGYKIKKGFFNENSENLPQIIAIFGEANTANLSAVTIDRKEITSADEAGRTYGFGSPIHQMMRILRPLNSDGIGGIPTIVFPQLSAVDAVASKTTYQVTGTASANATHSFVINGRYALDFKNYSYNIVKGDTANVIAQKISDAINSVQGSPVTAVVTTNTVVLTAKWKGKSSNEIKFRIDLGDIPAGITYSTTAQVVGVGDVSLADSLSQIEDTWITAIVNPYQDKVSDFEDFNGFPFDLNPTGRYQGRTFKPFLAFLGTVLDDKDDLALLTANSGEKCTTVVCTAPKSEAFTWEVAVNTVLLFSRTMQDTPEIDVNGMAYPDLPSPTSETIGDMSDYNNRDFLIKKGVSTVTLEKNEYVIQDLVTTYHPDGEYPLQYSYCRNLNIDWNIADAYRTLEKLRLKDKVLIRDKQVVNTANAIRPKEWKAVLFTLFDELGIRALINEPDFSKKSLLVNISATNPNRFETFFRYKRTGIARIESTDVEAGF